MPHEVDHYFELIKIGNTKLAKMMKYNIKNSFKTNSYNDPLVHT